MIVLATIEHSNKIKKIQKKT